MDAKTLYSSRRQDIAGLLDLIKLELEQHAEHAEKNDGPNYAEAGDLGHVRERLIQTLAFLAQQDEEFVKETLADVAAGRRNVAPPT